MERQLEGIEMILLCVDGGICHFTPWTTLNHVLHIFDHERPIKSQSYSMDCVIHRQMASKWVGMKGYENNVSEHCWDQLQSMSSVVSAISSI